MEQIRFGFIGTGGANRRHLMEVNDRSDARIVALCDVDQGALQRTVAALGDKGQGVRQFTDVAQMLAAGDMDAVVIATPHTQHAGQIIAALQHGLHVLVEKPLATMAADARAILQAAKEAHRIVGVAYQRHGSAQYRKAQELVASCAIGDIRLVTVLIAQDCLDNFLPGRTWRADPALSGGGHFMDTGSHINDMMLWVSGLQPATVSAHIDPFGTLVDVCTAVSIGFANGAVGTFAATSLSPEWREEFSFYGTLGVLNVRDGRMTLHRKGEHPTAVDQSGPDITPIGDFVATLHGEKAEPQAGIIHGLYVAQVSEAAYLSAKTGRVERVG